MLGQTPDWIPNDPQDGSETSADRGALVRDVKEVAIVMRSSSRNLKSASGDADPRNAPATVAGRARALDLVYKAIAEIRYGTVQVIVQDGRIVQIDKTEKTRLA